MKTSILLFLAAFTISISAQNIPIDFEASGNGADWTWTTFENGTNPPLEIVPNPDPSGINTSETVAKFTALQTGQPFAGCESLHGADIGTFTINDSTSKIKIMVWKPVISDVGIKLVRADNWSLGEIKISNTVINQWEELEFDFTEHIGLTYDQIVIFPDFDGRAMDNEIYFDNIFGASSGPSSTNNSSIQNDVILSPNPAGNYLTIGSTMHWERFEVRSMDGRLLQRYNSNENIIDISSLPNGIFILLGARENKVFRKTFFKI